MEKINERLDKIEDKVDNILEILTNGNLEKMGKHVEFVERVYDNVKAPLGYVCQKLKILSGNKVYELEDSPSKS